MGLIKIKELEEILKKAEASGKSAAEKKKIRNKISAQRCRMNEKKEAVEVRQKVEDQN